MDDVLQLTEAERGAIAAVLTSLSTPDKLSLSLEYLLRKWQDFVLEIEDGYDDSVFDYTNNLGKRDFLEELVHRVPTSVQTKLLDLLQPWDARFKEATKLVEEAILPSSEPTVVLGYWWYRVPNKLKEPIYDPTHWAPYYT